MTGRPGWILAAVLAVAAAAVALVPPIPQDPGYHRFADDRALLGVPNGLNVLSNMPFTIIGALGIAALLGGRGGAFRHPVERRAYLAFFVGVALTGVGSAYYHLAPDNGRLVWDRLPMTLAFMGLLSSVVAERVGVGAGRRLLLPLLAVGAGSVLHWHLTERAGAGDLRLYALVQFLPLLVVPVLMVLHRPRYTRATDLLHVIALYGVAKVLEWADGEVFRLGHLVSGHTLKHLAAAAATWVVMRMLKERTVAGEPISSEGIPARP